MAGDLFRCNFHLDPDLENIHVVAIAGSSAAAAPSPLAGTICGIGELERFIADLGLDSIVTMRQLRDQPVPLFEYTFNLLSVTQIVAHVEGRLAAKTNAEIRIVEGMGMSDDLKLALVHLEAFVLGSSTVQAQEGMRRVAQWFSRRSAECSPTRL